MAKQKITIPTLHKTTNPKHREDYVFVEKPGEDFTALKLISGPFSSIVYKYGNVGFRPESEKTPEGALPMVFDYTIICLLYTSPSPRDRQKSRMPSSA